ncbi:MAG: DUF1684 domain-containing protein [Bacteroidetes bacterium]|nr:MAG: DUF1684 domain-containing protein [Bacteroidota bacterium]
MNKILYGIVGAILVAIVAYTFLSQGKEDYTKAIAQKRFEKERFFLNAPNSPFKDKQQVQRLAYFAPDERYKVQASIEVLENPETVEIPMSGGKPEMYLRYAYLHFSLAGKAYKLTAYRKTQQSPMLWVGFRDETSGKESYGGGRYLDLAYRNGQKTIALDFNLAYNPFCAYSEGFACPIPPRENTLPTRIEAGEKNLKEL